MEHYESEIARIARALMAKEIDSDLGCRLMLEHLEAFGGLPDDEDATVLRAVERRDEGVSEDRVMSICCRLLLRFSGSEPSPA